MAVSLSVKPMRVIRALGIEPWAVLASAKGIRAFRHNRMEFLDQAASRSEWVIGDDWPCLADRYAAGGVAKGQYFHQDLWVAQRIFAARPAHHVDVGSRVDGVVAHLAAFMPVEVLDIRPLTTTAANISFTRRDLMSADPAFDGYTDSLSCLHALEHFGLGRYGDAVDYDGHRRGFANLSAMLRPGGRLYLSLPISRRPRVEFDAHRLFDMPGVIALVEPEYTVEAAAVVNDDEDLVVDVDTAGREASQTFGIEYGCVILDLVKRTERPADRGGSSGG